MPNPFDGGFNDLDHECEVPALEVTGRLPDWLSGTLVRNGPAKFHFGTRRVNHWFDGLAMLHQFSFDRGRVSYANKFLRTADYEASQRTGQISYSQFASDPCRTLFQKLKIAFFPQAQFGQNTLVNVAKVAERFVAMTESTIPVEFDLKTLKTLGLFNFNDWLTPGLMAGYLTTAHPHYDFASGSTYNYITSISPLGCSYKIYQIPKGRTQRQVVCCIPVSKPSYMHSFAVTERYIIMTESPFVVHPISLMMSGFTGDPFITNFRWRPEQGTRFTVVDKNDGSVVGVFEAEALFTFHHVNAFERDGEIVLDVSAYANTAIIEEMYLGHILSRAGGDVSLPTFRRYRLPLRGKKGTVGFEQVTEQFIEMPMISYQRCSGKDYRYAYGVGYSKAGNFIDSLVKIDIQKRESRMWSAPHCYTGEGVFVPAPGSSREDDGVVLAVVMDAKQNQSFLLALNSDFEEIARATAPHVIPAGLHGDHFNA